MNSKFKYIIFYCLLLMAVSCNQDTTSSTRAQSSKQDTVSTSNNNKIRHNFSQYINNRFGFSIDYPKDILEMQSESECGDGNDFMDAKDSVIITVFGRRNEDSEGNKINLSEQLSDDLKELKTDGSMITYQKLGQKFYVISGLKNSKVFYRKTITIDNAFAFTIIEYQQKDSAIYNPLIAPITASFKPVLITQE